LRNEFPAQEVEQQPPIGGNLLYSKNLFLKKYLFVVGERGRGRGREREVELPSMKT
jgi:hypothetical protein